MKTKINTIKSLANKLPSGLVDNKALNKLTKELVELKEEMLKGDLVAATMEAADVCYYAIKSEANRLISEITMHSWFEAMSARTRIPGLVLLDCCIAKYTLRAREGNPKKPDEERWAVTDILHSFLAGEVKAISYLIIKSGGMANKSRIEDVLMARVNLLHRRDAHDVLNEVEYANERWFHIGPTVWTHGSPEPLIENYPELDKEKAEYCL